MVFNRISDKALKQIAIILGPVVLGTGVFMKFRIESYILLIYCNNLVI